MQELLRAILQHGINARDRCGRHARSIDARVVRLVRRHVDASGCLRCRDSVGVQLGRLLPQIPQIMLEPVDALLALERLAVSGDDVDKFEQCAWNPGPGEVPVLDGVKGWVAGRVVGRFDAGDHVGFLVGADAGAAEEPSAGELGFLAVKDLEPGHEA